MAPRVGVEEIVVDDVAELESLWAREPREPSPAVVVPPGRVTITRHSPQDFCDRQIYVWLDGEALGKIRYGETLEREVEPGPHKVRVFNTLLSRTLTIEVAPGQHARLTCGTGMPAAGWLLMAMLHVTYLRVWLEQET